MDSSRWSEAAAGGDQLETARESGGGVSTGSLAGWLPSQPPQHWCRAESCLSGNSPRAASSRNQGTLLAARYQRLPPSGRICDSSSGFYESPLAGWSLP